MGVSGTILLWLTAVFGISHAIYAYRQEIASLRVRTHAGLTAAYLRAFYYALWALLLWLLLGSYVVVLWMVAAIPYLLARVAGKTVNTRVMTAAR